MNRTVCRPRSLFTVAALASALCLAAGCAAPAGGGGPGGAAVNPTVQRRANIARLKVGMTQAEVFGLIGAPARVNNTLTAAGTVEQHVYAGEQFRTAGESFLFGMAQGAEMAPSNPTLFVSYQNGRVSAISGQGMGGYVAPGMGNILPAPGSAASTPGGGLPRATPVPGQPGYVVSPYAPQAGYVDVRAIASGKKGRCPYTGQVFLVP